MAGFPEKGVLIRNKAACSVLYPLLERMLMPMHPCVWWWLTTSQSDAMGRWLPKGWSSFSATLEATLCVISTPQLFNNPSHSPFSLVPQRALLQIFCSTTHFPENKTFFISDGKLEVRGGGGCLLSGLSLSKSGLCLSAIKTKTLNRTAWHPP